MEIKETIPGEKPVDKLSQKTSEEKLKQRREERGETEDWKRGQILVEIVTGCLLIKGKCKIPD